MKEQTTFILFCHSFWFCLKVFIWCWEGLGARGEGDDRGWDGWMASPTQWTWVSVNSGSWWWTGRPDVLQFMGSQRVGHDWTSELNWCVYYWFHQYCLICSGFDVPVWWKKRIWLSHGKDGSPKIKKLNDMPSQNEKKWVRVISALNRYCCCPITRSCPALCDTMDCSMPGSSVLHYLLLRFMSIESVMPSNYIILCHPLLLSSVFPSIRVFSSE